MGSLEPLIYHPLSEAAKIDEKIIGGKAAKLARLANAEYRIPEGFCITVFAYRYFVGANRLHEKIGFELGRKPFESMRWEEIWDAALRIRSKFQTATIPADLATSISIAYKKLDTSRPLVVRSSAPKEDSARLSFAGLHESVVGVEGESELLDAVLRVWASLWSDAALLYQQELGLDPLHSTMAVVVQELLEEDVSGVAFGRDPRIPDSNQMIIEAVPGLCQDLVDGVLDPDRWIMDRSTGELIQTRLGERSPGKRSEALLDQGDLQKIYTVLMGIEKLFGWVSDTEWTGRGKAFTLLQARPITTSDTPDEKAYYLSLRPKQQRLRAMLQRVANELIPQLEAEGEQFASEDLSSLGNSELAITIEKRQQSLKEWRQIYREDFIPFAHGVRHLGIYYNDAVHPSDPYEFVGLLKGQTMIATLRNQQLVQLADQIKHQPKLLRDIQQLIEDLTGDPTPWQTIENQLSRRSSSKEFFQGFQLLINQYMDISYHQERLKEQPLIILKNLIELAKTPVTDTKERSGENNALKLSTLEKKLFEAVGPKRESEAREVLHIGQVSWRLRDDDNLLLGRIESQLLRSITEGANRLSEEGRLESNQRLGEKSAATIAEALRHPEKAPILMPDKESGTTPSHRPKTGMKPRQLIGQPAAPGLISGRVRIVRETADLGRFQAGEILVCDAIQPNMTHLVPLAQAIIERRGGMLIHGAIIARELGIPCVNGVPDAADLLEDGELVTVDGYLGIVTAGTPGFELELG